MLHQVHCNLTNSVIFALSGCLALPAAKLETADKGTRWDDGKSAHLIFLLFHHWTDKHTLLSWNKSLDVQSRGVYTLRVELLGLYIHSKCEHDAV